MGTIFIPVRELRPRGVKQLVQGGTASVVEARLEPQISVRGWSGGYEDPSIQDMFVEHLLLPGPVLDAAGSDPRIPEPWRDLTSTSWLLPRLLHCPVRPPGGASAQRAGPSLPTSLVCRGSLCGGSCPGRCRSYSSISGFHSVEVSSMCPSPQGDNLNRLQTLPSIPWREKWLRTVRAAALVPAPLHSLSACPLRGTRSPEDPLLAEVTPRRSWPPGAG